MAIRFGSLLDDVLMGTNAADVLFGLDGDDVLFGLGGDDLLFGGSGHDFLDGGDGNDVLWGGSGNDIHIGGVGNDLLLGGDGSDTLVGGTGADTLLGGLGDDVFEIALGSGADTISDISGFETLEIEGTPFFALDDVYRSGNNLVVQLDDGSRATIVGHFTGNALEQIHFPEATKVSFGPPFATYAIAAGFDGSATGSANEIFVGTDVGEVIIGGDGADYLFGHGGDDTLLGGGNDDYLEGGAGADAIDGGTHDGQVYGGDLVVYAHSDAPVTVNLGTGFVSGGHATGDTIVNVEGVMGSDFGDTLTGSNVLGDRFLPRGGNDVINGLGGFDQVDYADSPAGVSINLALNTAPDGWGGIDTLLGIEGARGSEFDDTIIGSDLLIPLERFRGRGGDDLIDGGAGFDEADYSAATAGIVVDLTDMSTTGGVAVDGQGGVDTLFRIESIRGSTLDDSITGDGSNNSFHGLAGDDFFDGRGGTDTVTYGFDAGFLGTLGVNVDLATGIATDGFGDTDTLVDIETVIGTAFDDELAGDDDPNTLGGLGGNDILDGRGGDDQLFGDAGNETYRIALGSGADTISDISGFDTLEIKDTPFFTLDDVYRSGNDLVVQLDDGSRATVVGHFTGSALEQIHFPEAAKLSFGQPFATYAIAAGFDGSATGTANEIFVGTDNGEVIIGGDGTDYLFGHGGGDTLLGGGNDDYLEGGAGADAIDGGTHDGQVYGGDLVVYAHSDAPVTVNLGTGFVSGGHATGDTIVSVEGVMGSDFGDTLTGSNLGNRFVPRGGNDVVNGLGGFDQVDYGDSPAGVSVNLASNTAVDGWGGTDALFSIEGVRGSEFDDTIIGSDLLIPLERFRGRGGDDLIDGGAGFDEADYSAAPSGVTVDLTNMSTTGGVAVDGQGGVDTLFRIESIRGSTLDDSITGDGSNNSFHGLAGDDFFDGRGGTDTVTYGSDADFGGPAGISVDLGAGTAIDGFGDADSLSGIENVFGTEAGDTLIGDGGANELRGAGGNDELAGGGGNDTLNGGNGDDRLTGGADNDALTGGGGADRFVFDAQGADQIIDFNPAVDRIDLSQFGTSFAALDTDGDGALEDGEGDGVIAVDYSGANTVLSADSESITVLGVQNLVADDFFF